MKLVQFPWPEESVLRQSFSLPMPIIMYMIKNPVSPAVYQKLIKCCKFFFQKNPILVAPSIMGNKVMAGDEEVKYDVHRCSGLKLWITESLVLNNGAVNLLSTVFEKLYSFDIPEVQIRSDKVIEFEYFKRLALSAEKVVCGVKMLDHKWNNVKIDEFFSVCLNAEALRFSCEHGSVDHDTAANLLKLDHLIKVRCIAVDEIPLEINLGDFWQFIKKHRNIKQWYRFDDDCESDELFMQSLGFLVDRVLEEEDLKCLIWYEGQNIRDLFEMMQRYKRE